MKQIFKHPRTFVTGLAAVGIAPALATVAQADTEPFPAELTQLIAEAKALNIQVVEGPNKTFGTNVDLQTYYDNLVHQLQDLVIQAKETKTTNENAQKAYQEAQAKYEKDLADYEAKQKAYEAQKTQFSQDSDAYKKLQADYQKQLAEYQKKLDAWKQQSKADADAQAKYQADLAQYEKLKQEDTKAQAEYEKKKADYEKASTQASEDTSHYNEAKKEYAKAMADYQAKLAQYKTDLADYETKKAQYDKDLAEYNKAVAGSSTSDSEYAKKLAEYETAKKKYDADLAAYNQAQAQYLEAKKVYDAQIAQMEADKNKPGHLSQAVGQAFVFNGETNATVKITGGRFTQPKAAVAPSSVFQETLLNHPTMDEYNRSTTVPTAMVTEPSRGDSSGWWSMMWKVGDHVRVEYTNLTNTSFAGRKISKVVYNYDVLSSSNPDGLINAVVYRNPTVTIDLSTDNTIKTKEVRVRLTPEYYYEDGTKVDFSKASALITTGSTNYDYYAGQFESVQNIKDMRFIPITGSSIVNNNGIYAATRNNSHKAGRDMNGAPTNGSTPYDAGEWDRQGSPLQWYGMGAFQITGANPSFEFVSQTYAPNTDINRYKGYWQQLTTQLVVPTAIVPTPPIKPTEPVKPDKVTSAVPSKPVEPKKPVAPEKPSITPPVTPNTPPTTPPTPPTPKTGEKPKEPTPKAGEKPKEPQAPNRPQPKDPADPATTPPVKPEAPKVTPAQIPPFTVQKGSVTELKTTRWITVTGATLKAPVVAPDFKPKDTFPGYEFVETKVDGSITTHIYRPIEKPVKKVTTIWITEKGQVLKPRTDGEHPKENFDGYEFVRTDKDKDGNTTHIYRPIEKPTKKVTTIWVTEKGQVLKPRTDGEHPKENFDGYEFVRTDKDKDGNTTHIYRPIEKPTKKVTTIWVTEKGEVLKPRTDGEHPKENFDGYEFVRTDKDKDGNTTHIYRPIKKVTTIWVTEKGEVLKPRTDGEQPKENFDGYEFVRTDKDKDGNTTHIYRKVEKPVKKVTTIWVTEKGQVLKPRTDGEQPKENFDGYEFVRTNKDKDGNTTHIYRKVEKPVKKVTTIWVTEKGEVLKPRTDGEQPKENFDGYEFVRTDKDKDGNISHIYRKVEKPKVERKDDKLVYTPQTAKELPKTGDAGTLVGILGGLLASGGLAGLKRKKRQK